MKLSYNMARNQPSLLLTALWLWSSACAGATFIDKPLTYQTKNSNGATVAITIPYIITEDKALADRINIFLHQHLLGTLPPTGANDASTPRLVELEVPLESMTPAGTKLMNGDRTLSVFVETEGCGAYCSSGTTQVDFDTRTGRVLTEQEIVTPQGKLALGALAVKAHGARLRREIARLNKLGNKRTKERSADEIATQLEIYETCLNERYTKGGGLYEYYLKDPGAMVIQDRLLAFGQSECASHSTRALDDLGDYSLAYKGEQLRPYLSAYGKYLLLGEGNGAMPAINPYAQLFRGKINNTIAVTLYLGKDNSDSGDTRYSGARYFYDKYRKLIKLTEKRSGDLVELIESDSKETPQPALSFRIKGQKLVGQWRGGGKTYPFEATP